MDLLYYILYLHLLYLHVHLPTGTFLKYVDTTASSEKMATVVGAEEVAVARIEYKAAMADAGLLKGTEREEAIDARDPSRDRSNSLVSEPSRLSGTKTTSFTSNLPD